MTSQPVALVTGASRGIGFETSRQLLDRGYAVVLGMRGEIRGREAASRLPPESTVVDLDVTNLGSIALVMNRIESLHGRLDVLVNNAAIGYDTENRGVDVRLDFVREEFETNFFGAWAMIQASLPLLRKSAHGRIVNVSSEGGSLNSMSGGTPAYSTSKAALNALTRVIAGEVRGDGILVNAICPGWTSTDMGGSGGRPVRDGAASVVWGATLSDDGPTGGFYRDGERLPW